MTKETGGPAYPNSYTLAEYQGQTLRDHFAGLAMQGFATTLKNVRNPNWSLIAEDAYKMADAMLEARK